MWEVALVFATLGICRYLSTYVCTVVRSCPRAVADAVCNMVGARAWKTKGLAT